MAKRDKEFEARMQGMTINEIRTKLRNLDDILQDNCETCDWAHYSIKIDEIQESINQLERQIRADAISEFVDKICEKFTEEESKGNYKQYCANIKQVIADIAEQMKGGVDHE